LDDTSRLLNQLDASYSLFSMPTGEMSVMKAVPMKDLMLLKETLQKVST
jgi:hypothetical protein